VWCSHIVEFQTVQHRESKGGDKGRILALEWGTRAEGPAGYGKWGETGK
jgi:hypothetical protein